MVLKLVCLVFMVIIALAQCLTRTLRPRIIPGSDILRSHVAVRTMTKISGSSSSDDGKKSWESSRDGYSASPGGDGDRRQNSGDSRSSNNRPAFRDRSYGDRSYGQYPYQEKREPTYGHYDGDHIYGIAPVKLALLSKRRKIKELLIQSSMELNRKKDSGAFEIIQMAEAMGIETREFPKHDLNMLTNNRVHQGFVLRAEPLKFKRMTFLEESSDYKCVLALDEVWDPQNFGALLRTSYFLGVDKIVVCAKNSAPLSPAVSKASAGAMELMENIYATDNMMKFLDKAREAQWQVVGTALTEDSKDLEALEVSQPTILVLGNEGHGIRTNVLRRCTQLVKVGFNGNTQDVGSGIAVSANSDASASTNSDASASTNSRSQSKLSAMVDSLNVSVTGGIILHHLLANRK